MPTIIALIIVAIGLPILIHILRITINPKKFEKYFSENLSKCITHPPDTEIAKPADLYPPDNIERTFHLILPI